MPVTITSPKNPKVRHVTKLGKRSYRDRMRQTTVEGGREVERALNAGYEPVQVFICTSLLDASSRDAAQRCSELANAGRTEVVEVNSDVFAKIAYRESTGGLLVILNALDRSLDDVPSDGASLVLVVEGAEKPGNLGALLRSADAAGVDLVIACGAGTDVNNPNAVRASLGAIFTVPIVESTTENAIAWLDKNELRVVAASPDAAELYTDVDMTGQTAIVVGSESDGLSDTWLETTDVQVRIPMAGRVDSLNLSASTAVLLFEAVRQRLANDGYRTD